MLLLASAILPATAAHAQSAPTITSVSPSSGTASGGNSVVITGTNFTGVTAVNFGVISAQGFTVDSATQITATAPVGTAGQTVDVIVSTSNGTATATGAYTFTAPLPVISTVYPSSGSMLGGNSVSISGLNFTGATAVTFDGVAATGLNVLSPYQISVVAPAHSVGAVDIAVTTPGGTTTATGAYTYVVPVPVISTVSPNSGSTAGGTRVYLSGNYLTGTTAVSFGGVPALYFQVLPGGSTIVAYPPPGALGAVNIDVTNAYGTATVSGGFTYVQPTAPTVSGFTPSIDSTAGGNTITIFGINLSGATAVSFGGTAATSFTVLSATQISAVVPAHAAGAVSVAVTTPDGTATATGSFNYIAPSGSAPTISGAGPSSISTTGGNSVSITGNNFIGATAVSFGGTPATSFMVTGTGSITATAPAHAAGAVDITVTTPIASATLTSAVTYVAAAFPVVTAVSPGSGPMTGGTTVVITGSGFTGATFVRFSGATAASFTVDSDTQITAVTPVPMQPGLTAVQVTTSMGVSTPTAATSFYFTTSSVSAPTISGISPGSGAPSGGTSVTITGTNFSGASVVRFGGVNATSFLVTSPTQITAVTPAGSSGAVDVTVTALGGTATSTGGFTYTGGAPAPTISGVSPGSGATAGGASVVITGTNFTGATAVSFGGTAATSYTVDSATQITAVAPAGSAGTVAVAVTTVGGTASSAGAFTYIAAPTITAISPGSGPLAGGTSVVITGTGFSGASAVSFGGTAATSYTVDSATQITAVAPTGSAGAVAIAVTTACPSSEHLAQVAA